MLKQSRNRIYYGWLVVAAGTFIAMVGVGPFSGFGVFVLPMSEEFGWSRSAISLAASVAALVGGFSQPFMGRIFDRVGGRRLMICGLSGIVFMAHQIGGALSIQFSGVMRDVTGAYTIPFAAGGLLLLFASVVSSSIQEIRYSSRYVSVPEPG